MSEHICAKCESLGESRWRIRLENHSEGDDEKSSYRLCRGCWNELIARFDGSDR